MERYRVTIFAWGKDEPEVYEERNVDASNDSEAIARSKVAYEFFASEQEKIKSKHYAVYYEVHKGERFVFSSRGF
jgi:hypothetical protein